MARQLSAKKPKDLGYTIRTLLSYMGRHKFLLLAVAVLVTVSALANLLGTYMIRPVVNTLAEGDVRSLVLGVAVTAAIYAVGALSALGYTQTMVKAAQKVLYDIRRDLFAHLQTLPLRFFDTRRHGDVMSYFTNDVDAVSDALNNSFAMVIQSFIQVVGTLVILFILNWRLSLVVLVCYVVMFLYIRFSGKHSKAYYTKQQASLGDLDGYIEEMMAGQKVVKVFNHEAETLRRFRERNESLRRAGTGAQGYAATMVPAVVSISYINYAIVAVLGGIMALNGTTDVGSLASYLVFVRQAAMPINQFTQQSNFLLAALAGAERVFEVMDQSPEVDEGRTDLVYVHEEDGRLVPCAERTGRWAWQRPDGSLVPLRGDVRFEHVDFGYEAGHPILKDVSLYAKPGQKIAFVGSTGAGKTTITNLINRFYDVQSGRVLYDGIDVRDIKKDALRRSLGIVLQDTHLFSGTIADNIRFGKLDATQEEVERAARIANADSFIRRLPHGYDTMVTADGANLSQGQRQLLAIARAAVADPPVLILDEATSSIDTRTESLIEKGMDSLMEGRTVFVIAHRLSTVRNANAILVLEHGQVVERGDHEDLLAQKGEYYQLYHGMFELS
ncbi:MAG TPA: ABC transporter ATP-binding protein/permease [Candidatus Intestinimonas stercoravium]|uniref:ABC transporter ATP-binding protein n=1 Tax=uncultured Intestinimonas sp. TaxID=1689265 RepID=UPI001F91E06D|nr:ABC transporter ATP-binding protein [uncultured Intestinimonas sp.]HJA64227.1 ABC transporter ATP-binding protein/permease [Candidatus Intestinimonas stercoravium]